MDGTTTTTRASFNVSSITNRATARFSVNFTNAMIDSNYASTMGTGTADDDCGLTIYNYSSSQVRLGTSDQGPSDNAWNPNTYTSVSIFR